jgi:hypothetical protein
MKNKYYLIPLLLSILSFACNTSEGQNPNLKLVFIRHAEKPASGENLTCKGFNRSLQLPAVLYKKFGLPVDIYVPALDMGKRTESARMFQTITPFAVKYNLSVNSKYEKSDYNGVANAMVKEKGTVIIVWNHSNMASIIKFLGVKSQIPTWKDNDYDSIWIVTYKDKQAILTIDKEGLNPSDACSF